MIIKFWDHEEYGYPLIEIKEEGHNEFKEMLKKYKENDEYNFEEFLELIIDKDWFLRTLYFDEAIFF